MNGKRTHRMLSPIVVSLLLILSPGYAISDPTQEVTLADDACHYQSWADRKHDGNYIEWWYFNIYDADHDLQGIFSYFVTDPENRTKRGLSQVAAVAYSARGVVSEIDIYPPDRFSASTDRADVQIESNSIQVLDDDAYRIIGASRSGRLEWDLNYVRQASPWFAADRIGVGKFPWERMSWLIYMPSATVTGRVEVDGNVYAINAPGYHDHNWGEWVFTDARWNWAQYSGPGVAFELGDFIGKPVGFASIDFQGRRTVFNKGQYELAHTRWGFDPRNHKRYPIETTLRAEDENRRLILTIEAIDTHPLRGDLPLPLPDALIYEQTARYDGQLWEKNAQGQWLLLTSIGGYGFKEYTANRY
jgi:hypothetical protein